MFPPFSLPLPVFLFNPGCIQVYELFPLTAADGGCQKCSVFCRVPTGCSHRPNHLWRGRSCSGTCSLINHAAWSVCHSLQVQISVTQFIQHRLFFKMIFNKTFIHNCHLINKQLQNICTVCMKTYKHPKGIFPLWLNFKNNLYS